MEIQLNEVETMLFENRLREDEKEARKIDRVKKRVQRLEGERAQRNVSVQVAIAKGRGLKLTANPGFRPGPNGCAVMQLLPDPKPEPKPEAPAAPELKILPKEEATAPEAPELAAAATTI